MVQEQSKERMLKQALGYWDFTVSMRDIAGTVGDMLFMKGTATIGDGGADGKGLRIDTQMICKDSSAGTCVITIYQNPCCVRHIARSIKNWRRGH